MLAMSRRRGLAAASGLSLLMAIGGCRSEAPPQAPAAPGPTAPPTRAPTQGPTQAPTQGPTGAPTGGATPGACATDAKAVSLPPAYPSRAALPGGYPVTKVETRSGDRIVITAVSPKAFPATLADMQRTFSTNGWTLSEGEVEKDDAESNFEGNGFRGRWAIRAIEQCPGNTSVSVVVGPAGATSTR